MPTKPVACRVSLEVKEILLRRAVKRGLTLAKYLERLVGTDALRKR